MKKTGFTYVELIVAAVILSIVVAGVFSAFLSGLRFTGAFRHEIMAIIASQSELEFALTQSSYDNVIGNGSYGAGNYTDRWMRLSQEVDGLNVEWIFQQGAPSNANSTFHPHDFRSMNIDVIWDERQI